jgi:hypothetical protein
MTGRSEVDRLKKRLDATFERCGKLGPGADMEVQSDLASYLCVLVSGYLERAAAELVIEHARRSGGPTLQRYVEASTRRFGNANCERLKKLLGNFHLDWRARLDSFLVDEFKEAVDSIVSLRNEIAHGGSAGITYSRIMGYYVLVQRVIDEISGLCAP